MPYISRPLPEYPCKEDMWDKLKNEKRPILIYGMGNGADKLISRFEKYGIVFSDIFASDGFVRGHSYRGVRVKSFSEVRTFYSDFVIVLSFGSNRKDVIEMLAKIDKKYEMYVPDMPVCGEDEYFDREFYNKNYESICQAYFLLSDEESKSVFSSVVNYKLSGKLSYLLENTATKDELYSTLSHESIKTVIDAGAYNGDTVREAEKYFPNLELVYAIEPDAKNFKKLSEYSKNSNIRIEAINSGAWSECKSEMFISSGNRNSSVTSTASYKHSEREVSLITLDSLGARNVDYIKYDVEGAEYDALVGSEEIIKSQRPEMLVSLYHRSRDIFSLPLYLSSKYENYSFLLRRILSVPAWELDLIMIPKKGDAANENQKTRNSLPGGKF